MEGLGATRSYPTGAGSLLTFSDKPKTLTAPTSQEVTETSHLSSVTSQTFQASPHQWFPTGYHLAGISATSADILVRTFRLLTYSIIVISRLLVRLRLPVHRFAIRRKCRLRRRESRLQKKGKVLLMSPPSLGWIQLPWSQNRIAQLILRMMHVHGAKRMCTHSLSIVKKKCRR